MYAYQRVCVECERPLYFDERTGACVPCVVKEIQRNDRIWALSQTAKRGRTYYTELHANITKALNTKALLAS